MGLECRTIFMGWTRKQWRFVILRVFTPSLDFLDPPLDRNVFLGGLPWLSFPLAPVPESLSQVGPVWCGVQACTCRWCPALSITLLLFCQYSLRRGRCLFCSSSLLCFHFPPVSSRLTSSLCPHVCVSGSRRLTLLCVFCLLSCLFICLSRRLP